jgi:hypothetical protein
MNSVLRMASLSLILMPLLASASNHVVAKEVTLIINGKRLVASNIRFSGLPKKPS